MSRETSPKQKNPGHLSAMAAGEMSPLQAFGQGLLRLVTPEGRVLDPTQVLTEAG